MNRTTSFIALATWITLILTGVTGCHPVRKQYVATIDTSMLQSSVAADSLTFNRQSAWIADMDLNIGDSVEIDSAVVREPDGVVTTLYGLRRHRSVHESRHVGEVVTVDSVTVTTAATVSRQSSKSRQESASGCKDQAYRAVVAIAVIAALALLMGAKKK